MRVKISPMDIEDRLRDEMRRKKVRAGPLTSAILDASLLPPGGYDDLKKAAAEVDHFCSRLPRPDRSAGLKLARYVMAMCRVLGDDSTEDMTP